MGISQQHIPLHENLELVTGRRVNTKGSCATEDEEDNTNIHTSYLLVPRVARGFDEINK